MANQKQIAAAREGIIAVNSKIADAALHLSAIANSNNWIECYRTLSDEQFLALTNVPKAVWDKFVMLQNNEWKELVQFNFELHLSSQAKKFAEIINA